MSTFFYAWCLLLNGATVRSLQQSRGTVRSRGMFEDIMAEFYPAMYFVNKTHVGDRSTCQGDHVGHPFLAHAPAECAHACHSDSNCKAYSFHRLSNSRDQTHECVLLSGVDELTYYSTCDNEAPQASEHPPAILQEELPRTDFDWDDVKDHVVNREFVWSTVQHDIISTHNLTPKECYDKCQRLSECKAWQVCTPYNVGKGCDGCYLISTDSSKPVTVTGSWAAPKDPFHNLGYNWETIQHHIIGTYDLTPKECHAKCKDLGECKAWQVCTPYNVSKGCHGCYLISTDSPKLETVDGWWAALKDPHHVVEPGVADMLTQQAQVSGYWSHGCAVKFKAYTGNISNSDGLVTGRLKTLTRICA